jgi:hypothetical protein
MQERRAMSIYELHLNSDLQPSQYDEELELLPFTEPRIHRGLSTKLTRKVCHRKFNDHKRGK